MMSPRVSRSRPYQRKNSLPAAIALLAAVLTPSLCPAQDTTVARSDSATATSADSVAPPRSVPADSARVDTTKADSAGADSAAAARPPAAPADSLLGAACDESGGAPPDLVVVRFRSTATADQRAAVARAVGGTVSGQSEHAAPGSWYLRIPGSAENHSVADRLIQMPPVLEVGVPGCPS